MAVFTIKSQQLRAKSQIKRATAIKVACQALNLPHKLQNMYREDAYSDHGAYRSGDLVEDERGFCGEYSVGAFRYEKYPGNKSRPVHRGLCE